MMSFKNVIDKLKSRFTLVWLVYGVSKSLSDLSTDTKQGVMSGHTITFPAFFKMACISLHSLISSSLTALGIHDSP